MLYVVGRELQVYCGHQIWCFLSVQRFWKGNLVRHWLHRGITSGDGCGLHQFVYVVYYRYVLSTHNLLERRTVETRLRRTTTFLHRGDTGLLQHGCPSQTLRNHQSDHGLRWNPFVIQLWMRPLRCLPTSLYSVCAESQQLSGPDDASVALSPFATFPYWQAKDQSNLSPQSGQMARHPEFVGMNHPQHMMRGQSVSCASTETSRSNTSIDERATTFYYGISTTNYNFTARNIGGTSHAYTRSSLWRAKMVSATGIPSPGP